MNPTQPQPGGQPPPYDQPVQYDRNGRPIQAQAQSYAEQPDTEQPQVVYMTRPVEPQRQVISPEVQQRHLESRRRYPKLNLSEGEYIISAVRRHPIGVVGIWASVIAIIAALFALVMIFAAGTSSTSDQLGAGSFSPIILLIPAMLISLLTLLIGFVSSFVYNANKFYLTNESVIQHIQTSLFNQREQTISLQNIEDASFSQDGIMPHLFNYGLIRLSTQGDETTYRFSFASEPQKQIAILNNAVENFKNMRPIHG